ncbi:hypothetical protein D8M21_08310 [Kocuria sp. HSID16901]|nr:hypothetical protein D8M21_08310 [Kocuria sp. HSID16901]
MGLAFTIAGIVAFFAGLSLMIRNRWQKKHDRIPDYNTSFEETTGISKYARHSLQFINSIFVMLVSLAFIGAGIMAFQGFFR